jgi:hypothetical protein
MNRYAVDYHNRAKAIILAMLVYAKTLTGPRWREPTELEIEHFTLELDHILNWAVDGARRLGYVPPDCHYKGPLSEEQMQAVEVVFGLRKKE